MNRNELIELISEVKEVADQALPLESSVLKDQLTVMIAGQLMQERLMRQFPPLKEARAMLGLNEGMIAFGLTQLAIKKDRKWVWQTYCYFIKELIGVLSGQTGQVSGLVDERPSDKRG